MARPKDPALESAWRRRLRRQARSGLSIPAFCDREGVSTASFYAWRRRLDAPPRAARPEPPLFVPLHVDPESRPDEPPPAHRFEIELPHRVRLRCPARPDPEWLGRIVAALAPREDVP